MTDNFVLLTGFNHSDTGVYSADASDLGLGVGSWPQAFATEIDGKLYNAGCPKVHRDADGDVTHVEYRSTGYRFIVWND